MATSSNFDQNRERAGEENGVAVRGPVEPPEKLGIHSVYVTADYDICLADDACPENCPVDMFTWVDTPDHPVSEKKVEPTNEDQCIDCMLYVDVCPVDAIDMDASRQV